MTQANAGPEYANSQGNLRAKAMESMSKIGDMAKRATDEAKGSAATLVSEANSQVQTMLGERVGSGADLIGHLATSVRVAANELDRNAPDDVARLCNPAAYRVSGVT